MQRDVSEIKTDIKAVLSSLHSLEKQDARFDERLKALPSKGFIVTAVLMALALIAAMVAFNGQIRAYATGQPISAPPAEN
jgi:hypothetical protein